MSVTEEQRASATGPSSLCTPLTVGHSPPLRLGFHHTTSQGFMVPVRQFIQSYEHGVKIFPTLSKLAIIITNIIITCTRKKS